ncbi:alpha-xylosidase [Haloarcula onubensis]|uniref:Alpha-xylosidase n=1 Tax=Haloarcula onubensis TaxID=2950539 RepID=A0ABU2FPQ3_9EURY|nr:alpha-xylosidase [Halomicroarcula sp. S3CR25-11]MDS0282732.1 alpha-xylosidase [Halomicroarcula sp. S3CR25-11]
MTSERITVSAVADYAVEDDTVHFECEIDAPETVTERTIPVTLTVYDPRTYRFELQANPEVATESDYPPLDTNAVDSDVALDVSEADGTLTVDTGVLAIEVGLDEWSFAVRDTETGATVFEEQRADPDVFGRQRVDALGYAQEEINHNPRRVSETGTSFRLSPDEKIYGAGEQFVEFDRRGRELDLWHEEPLGTETERAYKNIPFYLSTNGYGLLLDTTARVHYDFGNTSTASGTMSVADDEFAYVFFYGPEFREVIERYTAVTGRPARPPKWSFGTWMSRLGYESREELETVAERLREEEIPSDVLHLDPFWMRANKSTDLEWDTEQFPEPEAMISELLDDDFRLSLWEHPHVPVGTEAFEEGVREGYFVTDGTGSPYVMDRTCQGDYRGALVDFTDPDAVEWWKDKHRRLLEQGVAVFKTDYGEYVPEDAVFANGKSGKAMHNLYPYLYNEAVYETVAEVNGPEEAVVWGRSAWTGSQAFPMHWGGDPQTSWNGMSAALRGGLSASLSGIAFWSHDIGGFRGTPSEEVYTRWSQFGLLSSNSRCHGTTPREPWEFGEDALDIFRAYANVRYRLLPYIYTYAEVAARTGLPVVRPLVLEYQDDPSVHRLDTQYLLGEDILVAPVFTESGTRSVYLPEGEWRDYWTDERYAGGRTVHMDVELDEMPVFVRAGSVVPQREPTQSVQHGTPDHLELDATLADGAASGRFYDADADELVSITVTDDGETLSADLGGTSADRVTLTVRTAEPDAVTVDGESLTRVDAAPESGEWTATGAGLTVVV